LSSVFFRTGSRRGAWNMAFDRLLMDRIRSGDWDISLRVYGWNPACLSIGKFQNAAREVNIDALLADSYDAVRSPTGGRAVWHETDVTYSLVAREDHPMVSGSTGEALRKVSRPMLTAMLSLGVDVTAGRSEVHREAGARSTANPCFTSHGMWEIGTGDGRKLVGSAQARSKGVVLEHGSILLGNDQMKVLDYLPDVLEGSRKERILRHLTEGIATLGELIPGVTVRSVEDALYSAFEESLGVSFREMSSDELDGPELDILISEFEHV